MDGFLKVKPGQSLWGGFSQFNIIVEGLAPSSVSQAGYLIRKTEVPEESEGEGSGSSSSGGRMSAWLSFLALLLFTHTLYYRRYKT